MNVAAPILSARGLTFRIQGQTIVDGVDLSLSPGCVHGLIGPNGAGKTTTIDLLSGFSQPDAGRVIVDGRHVTRLPPNRRARLGLARTFQESPSVPGMSVLDHVLLAWNASGKKRGMQRSEAQSLLKDSGLVEHALHPAEALPIGERRMLDVARALATRPSVLLLDEPFAGLDVLLEERLRDIITSLQSRGCALLIVEHRLAQLGEVADAVFVLVRGRLVTSGPMAEVLKHDEVRDAYVGRREARNGGGVDE